jgi:hypothetical protein
LDKQADTINKMIPVVNWLNCQRTVKTSHLGSNQNQPV